MTLIGLALVALVLLAVSGCAEKPDGAERPSGVVALVYGGSILVCILTALVALLRLAGYLDDMATIVPLGLPWLKAHLRLDALSAFFVLVVAGIGGVSALFGWGYHQSRHQGGYTAVVQGSAGASAAAGVAAAGVDVGHGASNGPVLPFFPLFLAGMILVPVADDAFTFLVGWEFMSLASWLLVLSTHREADTPRAARVYLLMAGFGTMALLLAFGVLAGADGAYDFAAIRNQQITGAPGALVLGLVLLGAGSKAGMVPLHVWLPLAHPAAPTHVSALMSGVMTKVALYALIRVLFDLLGPPDWWWGAIVLALGALTAVLGVLYALMQHDLKTLLAYHTVENIGIILIGLGLALAFQANGKNTEAALALTAALLHVLNHAIFKSLLFFGAGAVLAATGQRDMEKLGGLIHGMPHTAFAFLVGCVAISALPPLNGFVSEWLTFQAIINGAYLPQWTLKFLVPVTGALLALSAALATACFVKAFGVTFLGRPRSPAAAAAQDVGWRLRAAMLGLALACAVIGILPRTALTWLDPVVQGVLRVPSLPLEDNNWLWLTPVAERTSSYSGVIIVATIAALSCLLALGIHRFASARVRRSIPWGCGFTDPDPEAVSQYTASSFAQPIRRVFGSLVFQARETVDMPAPGEIRAAHFSVSLRDPAWDYVFTPLLRAVSWLTGRVDSLQGFTIRRYLTLMFLALVALMTMVALSQL